jgi:methylmalonyl-CoA mutase C-terminal domain/subunit
MVIDGLKKAGAEHVLLFGGGIIADEDIARLKKMGVGALFTPGASTQEIIDYLDDVLPKIQREDKIV